MHQVTANNKENIKLKKKYMLMRQLEKSQHKRKHDQKM